MKFFFISILLTSVFAMAKPQANIICSNPQNLTNFSINTKAGKVWYNDAYVVNGPVFSGLYSSENYVGEILGEIELKGAGYYLTLIMRNVNGKAQLEAIWYPKNNQNQSMRYFLDQCELK